MLLLHGSLSYFKELKINHKHSMEHHENYLNEEKTMVIHENNPQRSQSSRPPSSTRTRVPFSKFM